MTHTGQLLEHTLVPQILQSLHQKLATVAPLAAKRASVILNFYEKALEFERLTESAGSQKAADSFALLHALRLDLEIADTDPRLPILIEAHLALYLHLRAQDELIDEPKQYDREFAYIADLFSSISQRAFAQLFQDASTFFAFRESIMLTFFEAALWETDVYWQGLAKKDDLVRQGQKLLPTVIPLGAAALMANRADWLTPLKKFMNAYATSLQLLNDIFDIMEDHHNQHPTPVLHWLNEHESISPDEPEVTVCLKFIRSSVLDRAVEHTLTFLAEAEQIAKKLGANHLAEVVRAKAEVAHNARYTLLSFIVENSEIE